MTQLSIPLSRAARDNSIQAAIWHANDVSPEWSEAAYHCLQWFLQRTDTPFLCEDYRAVAEKYLVPPPSKRAFGAVILRAAKAGLIKKVGYGQVKNVKAHMANATQWQKV